MRIRIYQTISKSFSLFQLIIKKNSAELHKPINYLGELHVLEALEGRRWIRTVHIDLILFPDALVPALRHGENVTRRRPRGFDGILVLHAAGQLRDAHQRRALRHALQQHEHTELRGVDPDPGSLKHLLWIQAKL